MCLTCCRFMGQKRQQAAQPTEQAMANTKRIFRVKAVQQDANNEVKKHYSDVGTIVMHDSGETGTLFLNHLPGMSYALFLKKKDELGDERE
jgi:hypothetical protein